MQASANGAAGSGQSRRRLPGTAWSVRAARGPGMRPALEIYEGDTLIGVMVGTPVAPGLLRGAHRGRRGRPQVIAWGRRPADGRDVEVAFLRRSPPRRVCPAEFACLTDWCWVAVAEGRFHQVEVAAGGVRVRRRLGSRRS